jgi:hypothetical protein
VVEWGRLLSGYRGEILGRRFESCPPRHTENAFREGRVLFSVAGPHMGMIFESCPPRHTENAFREGRVFVRS